MNKSKKTYYCNWRLQDVCAYCGGFADTEDHVPSRCFLDAPLPDEPPVVPCCEECNKAFSLDEEYVSCIIDCMKENTIDVDSIKREKTRKTMKHSPKLAERISSQYRTFGDMSFWDYEKDRFERIIKKLAFGHLAYFNDRIAIDSDYNIKMWLLDQMSNFERNAYEHPYINNILPEVGSRALTNNYILELNGGGSCFISMSPWQVIQEGRYRFCTTSEGNKVKFVIAEYLAVEVVLAN